MPRRLDLVGETFGQLTVIGLGPRVYWGKPQASWRVRCECGREDTFPQLQLTTGRATACRECSRPRCDQCNAPFDRTGPTQRWCANCRPEVVRRQGRAHYHKRADDPAYRRKRSARANADSARKRRDDPAAVAAAQARYRARRSSDPERAAAARDYDARWKRARRSVLKSDPEAYVEFFLRRREAERDYQREWKRANRAGLTPEQREAQRLAARERRRQDALAELLKIAGMIDEIRN